MTYRTTSHIRQSNPDLRLTISDGLLDRVCAAVSDAYFPSTKRPQRVTYLQQPRGQGQAVAGASVEVVSRLPAIARALDGSAYPINWLHRHLKFGGRRAERFWARVRVGRWESSSACCRLTCGGVRSSASVLSQQGPCARAWELRLKDDNYSSQVKETTSLNNEPPRADTPR